MCALVCLCSLAPPSLIRHADERPLITSPPSLAAAAAAATTFDSSSSIVRLSASFGRDSRSIASTDSLIRFFFPIIRSKSGAQRSRRENRKLVPTHRYSPLPPSKFTPRLFRARLCGTEPRETAQVSAVLQIFVPFLLFIFALRR